MEEKRSSHSKNRRSRRQKAPAADKDSILQLINQLRATFELPEIKSQQGFDEYAYNILSDPLGARLEAADYITLSDFHFYELYDQKSSAQQLVQKWLNDSGKRPVLFAPGKRGTVTFIQSEEGDMYIVVLVLSLYH